MRAVNGALNSFPQAMQIPMAGVVDSHFVTLRLRFAMCLHDLVYSIARTSLEDSRKIRGRVHTAKQVLVTKSNRAYLAQPNPAIMPGELSQRPSDAYW